MARHIRLLLLGWAGENHHALNAQKQEIKNPNSRGEIFLRAGAGDCEGVAEKKAIN